MKPPNKRELEHIGFNHSSDIDFEHFMNLYKKCTARPYAFLVIDTTPASDNFLCFLEKIFSKNMTIWQLIMTIDGKIRYENLQYNIKREDAKISALLSGKIDKYEHN